MLPFVALACCALVPPAVTPAGVQSQGQLGGSSELRTLFLSESARAEQRRTQAEAVQQRLTALGEARDLWPLPPRLRPDDIPVITIDERVTADALQQLLSHECCAVHVRGFLAHRDCEEIASRLDLSGERFSNWNIHTGSEEFTATEVDKIGVTSGEGLESWERFQEYLEPELPLDLLLPEGLNPFPRLLAELNAAHPQGCKPRAAGRWTLPLGTFRRMVASRGLIHADTATLLGREAGEFVRPHGLKPWLLAPLLPRVRVSQTGARVPAVIER